MARHLQALFFRKGRDPEQTELESRLGQQLERRIETSLAAQWSGLGAVTAWDAGSIPSRGTKTLQVFSAAKGQKTQDGALSRRGLGRPFQVKGTVCANLRQHCVQEDGEINVACKPPARCWGKWPGREVSRPPTVRCLVCWVTDSEFYL